MKKVIFWSFYSIFYFFLVNIFINSYDNYKQQMIEERAKFAIADIERYFDKNKTYPSSIKLIYPNLEANYSELYGDFYKPLPNLPGWGEIDFFTKSHQNNMFLLWVIGKIKMLFIFSKIKSMR